MRLKPIEKLTIKSNDGVEMKVGCLGQFTYEIGGQKFKFAVTHGVGSDVFAKNVTHVASGFKVCRVAVTATYLPAFAKKNSDVERAIVSLEALIERVGAAKVRAVITAAEKAAA